METFGPRLARLPWHGARGAEKHLELSERKRIAQVRGLLDHAWLEDPIASLVGALRCVARGIVIVHSGARTRLPSWLIHDYVGQPSTSLPKVFGKRSFDMGAARLYALEGPDPFADRPVNLSTLANDFEKIEPLHQLLSHAGLHHQLRVVTYDSKQSLAGYFGIYLPKSERPYDLAEHRRFHAVVPLLRRWLATARFLGVAPLEETGLTSALEANAQPSYLVRDDGVVVFANRAGRMLPLAAREVASQGRAGRSVRLSLPAQTLRLVTLPAAADAPRLGLQALPQALAPVADALSRGLSDKDIARELGMPLATARTYVQRVFRKLRVSSRRELMLSLRERSLPPLRGLG
jgi:hypothetical protein